MKDWLSVKYAQMPSWSRCQFVILKKITFGISLNFVQFIYPITCWVTESIKRFTVSMSLKSYNLQAFHVLSNVLYKIKIWLNFRYFIPFFMVFRVASNWRKSFDVIVIETHSNIYILNKKTQGNFCIDILDNQSLV